MEAEHGPGEPDHFPNAFSDVVLGFHVVRRAGEYRWFSKKAMMAADVELTGGFLEQPPAPAFGTCSNPSRIAEGPVEVTSTKNVCTQMLHCCLFCARVRLPKFVELNLNCSAYGKRLRRAQAIVQHSSSCGLNIKRR